MFDMIVDLVVEGQSNVLAQPEQCSATQIKSIVMLSDHSQPLD